MDDADRTTPIRHTSTHTYTVEHFADPFKKCRVCDEWVDGYVVAPEHDEEGENWPCRHRGYDDLCPSWSPVDGCRCAEHLGFVDHPVRPENGSGAGTGPDA